MLVHSFLREYPSQTLDELIASSPSATILVPTLEIYHEVRGTLTLLGSTISVICLPPPTVRETVYSYDSRPYYITDANHEALIDTEEVDDNYLRATYFFVRKLS